MKRFREWLIPELLRVPDEGRRRRMFKQTILIAMGEWTMIAWLPTAILSPGLESLESYARRLGTVVHVLAGLVIVVGLVLTWAALGFMVVRNSGRRDVRKLMRSEGIAICVPCGYDLTGNTSGVCPECGVVGSVESNAGKAK